MDINNICTYSNILKAVFFYNIGPFGTFLSHQKRPNWPLAQLV